MRKIRPWQTLNIKGYLYRKKHGELNCIHCSRHIFDQTFPISKIVLNTKVYTAYIKFQFSTGSNVIRMLIGP